MTAGKRGLEATSVKVEILKFGVAPQLLYYNFPSGLCKGDLISHLKYGYRDQKESESSNMAVYED
jgi:hypothetical protein